MVRGGCTHLFFKRNHIETISGYYHFETLPIYHQPTDQCLCILLYRKGYRPCVSKPSGFRTDRFWPFDNEPLLSQAGAGSALHTSKQFFFFFYFIQISMQDKLMKDIRSKGENKLVWGNYLYFCNLRVTTAHFLGQKSWKNFIFKFSADLENNFVIVKRLVVRILV